NSAMQILRERPDQTDKIFPERSVQPDQQSEYRNAQNIRGHALPGVVNFARNRLIPDITETQEIGPGGVGHAVPQMSDDLRLGYRHRSPKLRGDEQQADADRRSHADEGVLPV